jgi:hypothetical protein
MDAGRLTSELMWTATLFVGVVDALLIWLVARLISPARFPVMKWPSGAIAGAFYFAVWMYAMWGSWWELAYHYIFPEWARWVVPPVYGLLFGAIAVGFWWLAQRIPGRAVVNFCLLGGLVSLAGHSIAFFAFGMLEKVPVLRGVSAASALVFGIAEFIVYWSAIVLVAAALSALWHPRARSV